jgi:iron complex outermembrane receptor protein/vitamin B12 transporter
MKQTSLYSIVHVAGNPSLRVFLRYRAPVSLLTFIVASLSAWIPLSLARADSADDSERREPANPPVEAVIEEMVVTGSRTPRDRTTLPNSTTVLTGEELDSSISTSLDDALRFAPGLQLTQNGAQGGRTQLSMRGLDPNHVVILIDGVRLNDPTNSRGGSFDPTTLALVDIDRVEIVRGPLSTVYGSDALAGAINIITRRAAPDADAKMSVRARGGRFHTGNAIAQATTGVRGVVGLSLGAAIDTSRDPNSDGGYDGASLKAKINTTLPFEVDFEAFTRIHQGSARSYPDSSGGSELATLDSMEDRDIREILFGFVLERSFGDLASIETRISRASRREDLTSPGIVPVPPFDPFTDVPPSRAGDEYKRWDLSFVSTWTPGEWTFLETVFRPKIVAGVDSVWEDGESDTYLDFTGTGEGPFTRNAFFEKRRTVGVFGELEQSIGPYVTLSGSLRYDTIPDENDRLSPAAGLTVRIPQTPITLFGHYSEGYKRPSFYALGNPLVGDPNLRAEKSQGWEIGVRGHALDNRLRGQISYFDIEVEDLIDFDSSIFRLTNQRRLISRGVELEASWQATQFIDLRGGVTFNPTDFEDTSAAPQNRSRWRGYAALVARPHKSLEIDLRILAIGPSKASSFQTGGRVDTLAGYERIDVRVAWSARKWLDLFVEIENLTDRTYREAVGFESPGIAPRAGIVLRR